jgi:adenosine deaminase
MDVATSLDRLPKVELHCHVEGTMRPRTVAHLAHKNGIPLPTSDPTDLYRYTSLDSFLDVFWLVQSTLVDRDDWARLAYESVIDGARHGMVYRETFFTPARHLDAGADLADIITGLDEGLDAGQEETGARVMLICNIDKAYSPAAARQLVERLVELRRSGAPGTDRVLGIGADSTEVPDPSVFADAFVLAGKAGLRRTSHQGEETPPSTIACGVDVLGCERIDHGLSVLDDPELAKRLADQRVPLTVCPTSNIRIANRYKRLEDHPFPRMREAGLLCTLNTDDPALIGLDLGYEYRSVMEAFDYSWEDMVDIALEGIEATWLDEAGKQSLRFAFRAAADRLTPQ